MKREEEERETKKTATEKKQNSTKNLDLFLKQTLLQVLAIAAAMSFVRFGLEPLCKALRTAFNAQGPWVSF